MNSSQASYEPSPLHFQNVSVTNDASNEQIGTVFS